MLTFPILVFLAAGYLVYRLVFSRSAGRKLPPGPKGWPIIGNLFDLPPDGTPGYQHWLKHKEQYGPVSSVTVLGQTMVILHDREAVRELLETKSSQTSGRAGLEFGGNMCGFGKFTSFMQYDDQLRAHRKFIHRQLGTVNLAAQYSHVQEEEAAHLLLRLLETPQNLFQHFKTEAGAIILKIAYGYAIEAKGVDPLVSLIERMMANLSVAFVPLAWAVDIFPAMKLLPEWFPGGSFQKTAKAWKRVNEEVADAPYTFVQRRMKQGFSRPCYVSRHIEEASIDDDKKIEPRTEDIIKYTAAILYAGGSDTTVSSLTSFVLAMLKFPEVQRRAQEEIDAVTKSERLPRLSDRPNLPYVEAVMLEALRWFPVTPMAAAHAADQDTTVQGFFVPKGSVIMGAVWWLLHDPDVYEKPDVFDPTRFLAPRNEQDPRAYAFGFGRRICPGQHIVDTSLFLTIAQLLASFNMNKAVDSDGNVLEPQVQSVIGMVDRPEEFPYCITPRSPKHVELIRYHQLSYPWEDGDAASLTTSPAVRRLSDTSELIV